MVTSYIALRNHIRLTYKASSTKTPMGLRTNLTEAQVSDIDKAIYSVVFTPQGSDWSLKDQSTGEPLYPVDAVGRGRKESKHWPTTYANLLKRLERDNVQIVRMGTYKGRLQDREGNESIVNLDYVSDAYPRLFNTVDVIEEDAEHYANFIHQRSKNEENKVRLFIPRRQITATPDAEHLLLKALYTVFKGKEAWDMEYGFKIGTFEECADMTLEELRNGVLR